MSDEPSGGLSDVLRRMAAGDSQDPAARSMEDTHLLGAVDDEAGDAIGAAESKAPATPGTPATPPQRSRRAADQRAADARSAAPRAALRCGASQSAHDPTRRTTTNYRRPSSAGSIKSLAVPILATVGALCLIPAIWSLLLLVGVISSQRAGALTMAKFMLVCWPMSICLLGAAGYYGRQLMQERAEKQPNRKAEN